MRFAILALLLAASLPMFSQSKQVAKILAIEQQRQTAVTQRDTATLSKLLADGLSYTHSNGLVETKSAHLSNIASGKLQYHTMQVETSEVHLYKRSAVITGIMHVTGKANDNDFDLRLRFTQVYVKYKSKWRMAAWQSLKL